MRTLILVCSNLLLIVGAVGQPERRAFEVASIRPNPGPWKVLRGFSLAGSTLTLEGYNVADLIVEAYALEDYQLVIPPTFFTKDGTPVFYNIVAKVPGDASASRAEAREMIQTLLEERFHLKFHRESRETAVYSLLPGTDGVRLRETKPDAVAVSNHRVRGRNQTIESNYVSMEALARELRVFADRPVIDNTGLVGKYDVEIEATPYFRLNNPALDDITIFAALRRLGLRLEAERVRMPVIVVDVVDPPTEN